MTPDPLPRRDPRAVVRRAGAAVAAAAALTLAAAGAPAAATAASTPAPETAVAMLNTWRAAVGVGPVEHDPAASEGCRRHAEYHRLNPGTSGHSEDPALPGYSEEGHRAASRSVLAYTGGADGPYTWEAAVFHRTSLLNPDLVRSGFWSEHGLVCMSSLDVGREPPEVFRAHPYPYDGQTGVATTFDCRERPNPCDVLPGGPGSAPVGFVPSVQFDGPWYPGGPPTVDAASLTPDGGAPVAATVIDSRQELVRSLDGGVAVLPHRPLAEGTWYTLRVSGSVPTLRLGDLEPGTQPFAVVTRFRTRGPLPDTRVATGPAEGPSVSRDPRPTVTRVRARLVAARLSGRRLTLRLRVPQRLVGGRLRVRAVGRTRTTRVVTVRTRAVRVVMTVPRRTRVVHLDALPGRRSGSAARGLTLTLRIG